MIFRPSELKKFLLDNDKKPKKSLSQNFLIDGNILRKIIETAGIEESTPVIEIGPGPGALTQFILEKKAPLIAVEKDPFFAEKLKRFSSPLLHVICEDFLKTSLSSLTSHFSKKPKIIGNLPYQITTPILEKIGKEASLFSSATFMVQKEVGLRMTASPGSSNYSSLTLFLRSFSSPEYAFSVSKNSFFPVPKVDSCVIHFPFFSNKSYPPKLFLLIRTAFQQRRKTLVSSLKKLYPPSSTKKALIEIGLVPSSRPEELSLEQFLSLFEQVEKREE